MGTAATSAATACWQRPGRHRAAARWRQSADWRARFLVLAKRWVVERTHAWNERARRLVMHRDRLAGVSEAWLWLTEARMLRRRLTA
nr:transposase [Immundisolibacter cernigliae]